MSDHGQPSRNSSNSKPRRADKPLRKFYLRSGKVKWMGLAKDVDTAAVRFIQYALKGSLITGRKPIDKKLRLVDVEAMKILAKARLDSRILVSESGFSNSDAGSYATAIVIKRWHSQIAALEMMIRPKS